MSCLYNESYKHFCNKNVLKFKENLQLQTSVIWYLTKGENIIFILYL